MEHLDFNLFNGPVAAKLKKLAEAKDTVFMESSVQGDALWDVYLNAYPEEYNGIFRVRKEYEGNYDKNFIRRLGHLVAVNKKGEKDTIWNVTVPSYFQEVANAMHAALMAAPLDSIFLTKETQAGSKPTKDNHSDIIWTHFYSPIPSQLIVRGNKDHLATVRGNINTNVQMFKRMVEELTLDAGEIVLELINTNALYRGAEFKAAVAEFVKTKRDYDATLPEKRDAFIAYFGQQQGARFRNTAIGSLVVDLAEGKDLERAVASFESKVAPTNYKRTTSLITPAMVNNANKVITELGLEDALERRFASVQDLSINDVLFTSVLNKPLSVMDSLVEETSRVPPKDYVAKKISLSDFITNVLPTAKKVEALVEHRHTKKMMTLLTAKHPAAKPLFKWESPLSWSYIGNITDAIQERVVKAGGAIEGIFRASLMWHNIDDLDLSVKTPSGKVINFINRKSPCGGLLDVDANGADGIRPDPVENINWSSSSKLKKGDYTIIVDQWSQRQKKDVGFTLQVAFGGQVFNFSHEAEYKGRHEVMVTVHYDGSKFSIKYTNPKLKTSSSSVSSTVWGVTTNQLVPVTNIVYSPNHLGDDSTGNKHLFFLLEGAAADEPVNGFYNEFLKPELTPHRKVFEILGNKTKVAPNNNVEQLAGIGFSSTVRDTLVVRVTGKTKQFLEIQM